MTLVNCSGRGVKDLTGLEACTNLETIDCSNNGIPVVSLPRLTKLTTLRCYGNPVEKLDRDTLITLLKNRFETLDWDSAREDVINFIEPLQLGDWNKKSFKNLADRIVVLEE